MGRTITYFGQKEVAAGQCASLYEYVFENIFTDQMNVFLEPILSSHVSEV